MNNRDKISDLLANHREEFLKATYGKYVMACEYLGVHPDRITQYIDWKENAPNLIFDRWAGFNLHTWAIAFERGLKDMQYNENFACCGLARSGFVTEEQLRAQTLRNQRYG